MHYLYDSYFDTLKIKIVAENVKQLQSDHSKLSGRVSSLEMENKGYKEDIRFLKSQLSDIQKSDRMNQQKSGSIGLENAMQMTRKKRPARLFPEHILRYIINQVPKHENLITSTF